MQTTYCIWANKWYSFNIVIITYSINNVLQERTKNMKCERYRMKATSYRSQMKKLPLRKGSFRDFKWLLVPLKKKIAVENDWTNRTYICAMHNIQDTIRQTSLHGQLGKNHRSPWNKIRSKTFVTSK